MAPGEALSAAEARREEVRELGWKKVSLMWEPDMLELMRKLMQGAIELVGKGTGGDLAGGLTNREKTIVGDALREEGYLLASLLSTVDMRKSSHFYQVGAMKADRDAKLRDPVFGIFDDNERAYGRHRIHDEIGIIVGKCRISRILKEQGRIAFGCKSYKKNKRYDSYKKEISEHPNNKAKQDFTAGLPNFLVALRRHAL